jgi:hypothetical protein
MSLEIKTEPYTHHGHVAIRDGMNRKTTAAAQSEPHEYMLVRSFRRDRLGLGSGRPLALAENP